MTKKFVIAKLKDRIEDDCILYCNKCREEILDDTYYESTEANAFGYKIHLCTDCYLEHAKQGVDEVMRLKQFKWIYSRAIERHTCSCCHFEEIDTFFFNDNGEYVCTNCYHRHIKPPLRKKNLI